MTYSLLREPSYPEPILQRVLRTVIPATATWVGRFTERVTSA